MARGGKRPGAGRKSKAVEESARNAAISAIRKTFDSDEGFFVHLAEQANKNGSFNHAKLLASYAYGNPKENVNIEGGSMIQVVMPKKGKDE